MQPRISVRSVQDGSKSVPSRRFSPRRPSGSNPAGGGYSRKLALRVARWSVKSLQDRPTLLPVRTTTIHYLVTRVTASVTFFRLEKTTDPSRQLRPSRLGGAAGAALRTR
jgi:hypothetical protein